MDKEVLLIPLSFIFLGQILLVTYIVLLEIQPIGAVSWEHTHELIQCREICAIQVGCLHVDLSLIICFIEEFLLNDVLITYVLPKIVVLLSSQLSQLAKVFEILFRIHCEVKYLIG